MTDLDPQHPAAPPADSPAGRVKKKLKRFIPATVKFGIAHLFGLAGVLGGILPLVHGAMEPALAISLIVLGAVVELWGVVQFIKAVPKEKCPQCGRRLVVGKINIGTYSNAFRACSNCGADLWKSDGKTLEGDACESFAAEDTLQIDDDNPYVG
ncbi:MAG: hypothetical protein HN370_02705 [Phycisphaerales bacterium]|nr:hypothetical protein [Phycisphaerales bacterium]